MSALTDLLTKRIADLSAHQAELQARADREKAAVQQQINALISAKDLIEKDPQVEVTFTTLTALKLLPRSE